MVPSRALQESRVYHAAFQSISIPAQEALLKRIKSITGASREAFRKLSNASPIKGLPGAPSEHLRDVSGNPSEPLKSELKGPRDFHNNL